jgi:F-type H+-transporting ATPase subunit b
MLEINLTLLVQMVIFLVTMFLLTKLLLNPILQNITQRNMAIHGTRQEVELKEKEFKKQLEEYQQTIDSAKRRLAETLAQEKKQIEAEQAAIINKAREEASRLLDDARDKIRGEAEKARISLREQSKVFCSLIVRKFLGREPSHQPSLKMIIYLLFTTSLAAIILTPLAWATAEGSAHEGGISPDQYVKLTWQIINFVLLLVVLFILTRKNVASYFSQRSSRIGTEIDEARNIRAEMNRKIKEYEARLKNVDQEVAQMQKEAQREMEAMRQRMLEEAQRTSEAILHQTQRSIQLETRKAQESLQTEASLLAINLAEDLLKREISPEDQDRLVQDYLDKMGGSA